VAFGLDAVSRNDSSNISKFSGFKLPKWRFTSYQDAQQKREIFFPIDSIKIKFKVREHVESNAFGEVYKVKAKPKKKESS